ncbi:MAG TPA: RdgB/HAM1 family non-canonical purine NTP pyrophosphatase [Candidatus Ozemobacteraceae bacterium]|nr:RdgB/HAM1 family non-canonical purine NTP pyrophosphatase [Candidatus Ozemobacteraceae bacterium]
MKLWIATGNRHKLQEIGAILGDSVSLRCQLDLPGMADVDETGATYRENAEIKARALWERVREPVFADDSGLEVDALGGRPGIHSQRYSAPNPTHEKNIDKLLNELADLPPDKRSARFRCVICFIDDAGVSRFFEGTLEGRIGFERRGKGGFGFDPVFMLPERGCSVAELAEEEKNRISHRGRAVIELKRFLQLP